MRAIALSLLLAALTTVSCRRATTGDALRPADRATIEQAVLACHDQTLAAAEALDLDRLLGFVAETDRGSMISNDRLFLTRDDTVANTRERFKGIKAIKYETHERHVSVLSRTSALVTTTGEVHATTTDGRTFSRPYAQTIIFVLVDGAWRVLHMHSSNPPQP
jgi:hypothetical protein